MNFIQKDLNLFITRDKYLIYQKRNVSPNDFSGTNVMEVYYNYSCDDGFGGLSEKIRMDEICQMCEGLSAVTDRTRDSYSIVFDYHFYSTCPFFSLSLAREENRFHFQMCVYDICCDLQIDRFLRKKNGNRICRSF